MPKEYEGYTTKDERKAIKDAETVAANAQDETTKQEAQNTLAVGGKQNPNPKPAIKTYDVSSLKKNPFEGAGTDGAKAEYDKLSEEEKKKFVIRAKMAENMHLDKKEQHEISREDLVLVGVINTST